MANDKDILAQVLLFERSIEPTTWRDFTSCLEPTLFEDLALVRRWGRIGSAGASGSNCTLTAGRAVEMKWLDRKERRGHQSST